jgi:hypothetical protein
MVTCSLDVLFPVYKLLSIREIGGEAVAISPTARPETDEILCFALMRKIAIALRCFTSQRP